jgi:hypothetical protein
MDQSEEIIRRGQFPVPKLEPHQNERSLWVLVVPGEGHAGNQKFMSPTLEGLCTKLAESVWYGTGKIRQQAAALKDLGLEQEREAELRFAIKQAQGFYDEL